MQARKTKRIQANRKPGHAPADGSGGVRRKESVGEQRIASDQEIRRIDPVWLFGSVPNGFWHEPENRRSFLIWLSHRLGFRQLIDLYRLTYEAIAEHHGASVAGAWWHSSPVYAVKECFPGYDWEEWQFTQAPMTFWKSARNRRRYIRWLGRQLGFRRPADWYRITTEDFQNNRGGTLLLEYDSSVSATVMACFPRYHWKEWMFSRRCMGFWDDPANCRRYMRWLGKRLGYRRPDDWYKVKLTDFTENYGRPLVRRYRDSAAATVMAIVPRKRWHEWMFTRVPPGFWDDFDNRKRYIKWLGKRLGYRRTADWAGVRRSDFNGNFGGSLIGMYPAYRDLLKECFPDWDWEQYRRQNLTIKQILEWSDAYLAAHGEWPTATSGEIPEGRHNVAVRRCGAPSGIARLAGRFIASSLAGRETWQVRS